MVYLAKICGNAIDFFFLRGIIEFVTKHNTKKSARLCNGSTTDSDSVCLGSNPSPAAMSEQSSLCSVFLRKKYLTAALLLIFLKIKRLAQDFSEGI